MIERRGDAEGELNGRDMLASFYTPPQATHVPEMDRRGRVLDEEESDAVSATAFLLLSSVAFLLLLCMSLTLTASTACMVDTLPLSLRA
jgi:hypothetical protein